MMKMIKDTILQAVFKICTEKKQQNLVPAAATFVEIINSTGVNKKEARTTLRQLCAEGTLCWYNTLNSTAFYEAKQN